MKLLPLASPELIQLAAGWMSRKENFQWLDFGNGRQILTPEWLKIATQRDAEVIRVFTADDGTTPIGVGGLTNVDRAFKTARVWAVLGDKSFGARGHGTRATSMLCTLGFSDLGLHAINTWIVEHNPSRGIVRRLSFTPIGRQRQCHYIDGRVYDRLWFDILATEHREI